MQSEEDSGRGRPVAFSHLAVVVTDIELSARFYHQALGFERAERSYEGRGASLEQLMGLSAGSQIDALFLSHGTFLLELMAFRGTQSGTHGSRVREAVGFAHLSFVVDDINKCFERVRSLRGTALVESRTAIPFGGGEPVVLAFVTDPDGNRIELIEHPDDEARTAHGQFLNADSFDWPPVTAPRVLRDAPLQVAGGD